MKNWINNPCLHLASKTSCDYLLASLDIASEEDAREAGSIPGSGRSPGVGSGSQLQYSLLKIPWTEEPGGLQSLGLQKS